MSIKVEDIVPLKKYILIKPRTRSAETSSGIIMPEQSSTATPVVGDVIAVGDESQFKPGDTVFFRRFSVDELKFSVDGKEEIVSLISDDEVVAKTKNA